MRSDKSLKNLPNHMWENVILPKLSLIDYTRFAAVSPSWRIMASENQHRLHPLPWLMISLDKTTQSASFLCLSDGRTYTLSFTKMAAESRCCGSAHGYLVMENRKQNFLFHPFSQTHINLPMHYVPQRNYIWSMSSSFNYFSAYFTKSILSPITTTPNSFQCVVASLCANNYIVELCNPHDVEWSVCSADPDEGIEYVDVVYEDGDEGVNDVCEADYEKGIEVVDYYSEDEVGSNSTENETETSYGNQDDDQACQCEEKREQEIAVIDKRCVMKREQEIVAMDNQWGVSMRFTDILFYKEMFYAITQSGGLVVFEVHDSKPSSYRVLNVPPFKNIKSFLILKGFPLNDYMDSYFISNYLVESCGELLMVYRFRTVYNPQPNHRIYTTRKFLVFKLDDSSDPHEWVQLDNLEDRMLFLGKSSSMCISAKDITGFKGNCIYFSDDVCLHEFWMGMDVYPSISDNGVFYLEDERVESISTTIPVNMHPLWVMPSGLNIM